MSTNRFEIKEALRFGWDTVKANIGFFIALLVVAFLIQVIPRVIGEVIYDRLPLVSLVLYLIATVLEIVVSLGLIKVSVNFCDGIKGKLDDLLSSFHLVFSYFAAAVVYFLIVVAGLFLFVVPGVIWFIKYSMFPYFIVDEKMGPIEAIKASGKATAGAKFQLFLFILLLWLVNFGGLLALGIGLFVSIPVTMVSYAYVYRQLAGKGTSSPKKKTTPQGGTTSGVKGVMYVNLDG
jgi:uncharacterized membrane protein